MLLSFRAVVWTRDVAFLATGLSHGRRGGAGADGRDARDAGVRRVTRRQLNRASTAAGVCRQGRYLPEYEYRCSSVARVGTC